MKTHMKVRMLLMAFIVCLATSGGYAEEHSLQHHQMGNGEAHGLLATGLEGHPFVVEMSRDMEKMMMEMHSPGYTGNWDIDFLAMMIPHHQGAIDMARLVLIHGDDPLTRRLAEEIIASQQTEISAMRSRLAILRGRGDDQETDTYPALNGTRGVGNGSLQNPLSAERPAEP